jgi:C-terminal processing protease CtpA/Prc
MTYRIYRPSRRAGAGVGLAALGLALIFAGPGGAAAETDAEIEARMAETEAAIEARGSEMEVLAGEIESAVGDGRTSDAEVEARLAEAQRQMEAAAREVAELSAQLTGDAVELAMRSFDGGRPMLGIHIGATPDAGDGVLVLSVTPEGPADRAGLRSGDVITMIDGIDLTGGERGAGAARLEERVKRAAEGEPLALTVRRDDALLELTVEPETMSPLAMFLGDGDWQEELKRLGGLEFLEDFEIQAGGPHGFAFSFGRAARWGDMELVSLTPELGEYFGAPAGLLVVRAPADAGLGLRDGDVILAIDGRTPADPGHAMRILRSYEAGERMSVEIMRQRARQTLEVLVPAAELGFRERLAPDTGRALSG